MSVVSPVTFGFFGLDVEVTAAADAAAGGLPGFLLAGEFPGDLEFLAILTQL